MGWLELIFLGEDVNLLGYEYGVWVNVVGDCLWFIGFCDGVY